MSSHADELAAIRAVRDAFVAADNASDVVTMTTLLTDDVVILHPHSGIITGREAAAQFMSQVLDEVREQFAKRASYSTIELKVAGDFAFERGIFAQELVPRAGGATEYDNGQYLWLYVKDTDGVWRLARIAGAFVSSTEDQVEPC